MTNFFMDADQLDAAGGFNLDNEMLTEMRFQASTITDVDRISDADITLDEEKWEAPQTPQPTQPSEPSREARIAHYTKLVEAGEPLFPCDEDDDCDE